MRVLWFLVGMFSMLLSAADDDILIPDPNFKSYLLSVADTNEDGKISSAEAAEVENLVCIDKGLRNLTGIEHFTGLRFLDCSFNLLVQLPDLSKSPELEILRVDHNQLTSLPPLDRLVHLRWLYVFNNHLTQLPKLENCKKLTRIIALNNRLVELPRLDNLVKLEWLWVENNQLTRLPGITPLVSLKELMVYGNPLSPQHCELIQQARERNIKTKFSPLHDGITLDCDASPPVLRYPKPNPKMNMVGQMVTKLKTVARLILDKLNRSGEP